MIASVMEIWSLLQIVRFIFSIVALFIVFFTGVRNAGANEEQTFHEVIEYDLRWGFVSAGKVVISSDGRVDGGTSVVVRAIQVNSHGVASWFKRIDNQISSRREESATQGPTLVVTKSINEGRFRQHDALTVDLKAGRAEWEDLIGGKKASYDVPAHAMDYVSMLFDLRSGGDSPAALRRYELLMDDGVHSFTIEFKGAGNISTPVGEFDARRYSVASLSPDLFKRNVPGAIWALPDAGIILAIDVSTILGTVRAVLSKWEINGEDATPQLVGDGVGLTSGKDNYENHVAGRMRVYDL